MKQISILVLILLISSLACLQTQRFEPPQSPPAGPTLENNASTSKVNATPTRINQSALDIPVEYRDMYNQLNFALEAVKKNFSPQSRQALIFAAELSYANGNIGESLLRPEILALVQQQLDSLYQMGVRGVVVAIKFPMVEPGFPRSAEYLQFFKQVATEVRQRKMKLLIESGALFSGTVFSPLKVDWSQYPTAATFRDAEIHQLQTIAREIQPDYLQIANEPTTTAMLTKFSDTPEDYAAFVRKAVLNIPPQTGMLLGAGAGTWENQAYVTNLYSIAELDFIDLHVYPLGKNGNMLRLAAELAQRAHNAGKRVVISEAWLYKSGASAAYQANDFTTIIGRDVFSFWEPLDEKFIEVLTAVSQASGIEFLSFFWVREFFAYLDYNQYQHVPLDQINPIINKVSSANLHGHMLSPLGLFYQAWINQQTK